MAKRFTETEKWRDAWFRKLPANTKLAYYYLLDNCDQAGVWDPDFELACFTIGEDIDWPAVLEQLGDRLQVLDSGKWHLTKFITFQYGELSASCPPHRKVLALMDAHGIPFAKGKLRVGQRVAQRVGTTLQEEEEDKEEEEDEDRQGVQGEGLGSVPGPSVRPVRSDPDRMKVLKALPTTLRTEPIASAWERWRAYWDQQFSRGRGMSQATEDQHLRILVRIGADRAEQAIDNAISRGLREPDLPLDQKPTKEVAGDAWLTALAKAEGSDPTKCTTAGARALNTALGDIMRADPDVTIQQLEASGEAYRRAFPDASVSAAAIAKHWAKLLPLMRKRKPLAPVGHTEPPHWQEYLRTEMPDCIFAPGQSREAKAWTDIDADAQGWIIEGLRKWRSAA